jgi:Family of unknown function (DUF5317)
MRLVLVVFLIAIGLGYLLGGRLSWLSAIRVKWFPLAAVGLFMQAMPGVSGPRWPLYLLYASFLLLMVFAVINLRVTGFAIILIGIALNFTVIVVNRGMPVSRQSLIGSGQESTLNDLIHAGGAKHHVISSSDHLSFLADVIAIPPPVAQSASVGDLFTYGGVLVLIVAAMRKRPDDLPQPAGAAGIAARSADEHA